MDSSLIATPTITVLMPVYNCEEYIFESVESILNQTYKNFEFLIIDDCSTDRTVEICKAFNDERIVIIKKEENSGYTTSLNYGLSIAKGKYIARMDGDDISLPERFEKQISFMKSNRDVVVCGSAYSIIGTNQLINVPENNEQIKVALLKGNCMAHPSVMIRKEKLQELNLSYDLSKEPSEDYDLWVRLVASSKIHNLQEILLKYRVHTAQVSQKRKQQQRESTFSSKLQMLQYLKFPFDDKEYELMMNIIGGSKFLSVDEIKEFNVLKSKLISFNSGDFFDSDGFEKYLFELQKQSFKNYFVHRKKYNPMIFFQYFFNKNKFDFKLSLLNGLKLFLKSFSYYKNK